MIAVLLSLSKPVVGCHTSQLHHIVMKISIPIIVVKRGLSVVLLSLSSALLDCIVYVFSVISLKEMIILVVFFNVPECTM